VHTGKYLKQLKGKTDITPAFLLSCFKIWYSAYEHLDNAFGDRLNLPYRVMRHLTRTIIRFAHATCNNLNKYSARKQVTTLTIIKSPIVVHPRRIYHYRRSAQLCHPLFLLNYYLLPQKPSLPMTTQSGWRISLKIRPTFA